MKIFEIATLRTQLQTKLCYEVMCVWSDENKIFAVHFSIATKDKPPLIWCWYHQLPTSWRWQTHCTCFFLCVSAPPHVALSGVGVSVGQFASPLEMVDVGLTRSPLNFDPVQRLGQRGAAPLLNESSCPDNLRTKNYNSFIISRI